MTARGKRRSLYETSLRLKKEQTLKAKLWTFLNSTFGVFLLSTVFVSFFSWAYTQLATERAHNTEAARRWERLQVEIANRQRFLARIMLPVRSEHYKEIRGAIYGFEPAANVNPSWILHYSAVFPEYESRSLSSLTWELGSLAKKSDASHLRAVKNAVTEIEGCFDALEYSETKRPGVADSVEFYTLPASEHLKCQRAIETEAVAQSLTPLKGGSD